MKKVYQSNIEPKDTNVVWLNPETSEIKTFINGSWKALTASSGNPGSGSSENTVKRHIIELKKKSVSTQNSEKGISVQESSASDTFFIKDVISFTDFNAWAGVVDIYIDGVCIDELSKDFGIELLSDTEVFMYLKDPSDTNGHLHEGKLLYQMEDGGTPILNAYSFDFGTYDVKILIGMVVSVICSAKEYDDTFPTMSFEQTNSSAPFDLTAPVVNFQCTANSDYTGYVPLPNMTEIDTYKVYMHCLKTASYGSFVPLQNTLSITYNGMQNNVAYADKEYWYEVTCAPTFLKVRQMSDYEVSVRTSIS